MSLIESLPRFRALRSPRADGLIASLIAVAIITSVTLVGTNLTAEFNGIAAKL